MYIIVGNKNKITHISETIGYQENGNVLVDNDTLAIAKILVKQVYEIENIPEEVKVEKYCYTEEKGFYINEDYKEPINAKTEIEEIKEQITELQLAMIEKDMEVQ